MKKLLILITSFICFKASAGPSLSGGVSMAPWTRSAAIFSEVLEYLNEKSLIVMSVAFDKDNSSLVNTVVICPNRREAILVFDALHEARGVQVSLNTSRSQSCR